MALPVEKTLLAGWKEIANYLGKSERTVQRWERKGLPVYRHEALGVITYPLELDQWIKNLKEEEPALSETVPVVLTPETPPIHPRFTRTMPSGVVTLTGLAILAGLMGALWASSYGIAILTFCLGAPYVMVVYRGSDTPMMRSLVALYMIAAMAYISSGSTMPQFQANIINAATLTPSPVYVFITGLKFIPLVVLVFGTWVSLAWEKDAGFLMRPGWDRAYLLLGILIVAAELTALGMTSGDDRIWKAALPGRWMILIGSVIILGTNIIIWLEGRRCFRQTRISSYGRLFWRMMLGFFVIAFAAFFVDGEYNRINRYYLDQRWPEAFRADNADAIHNVSQLVRGPLKDQIGADLRNLIDHDAGFWEQVRTGVFYKQHSDEPFQLTKRAVIFGYWSGSASERGRRPFVTIRFPKELADALGFRAVGQ